MDSDKRCLKYPTEVLKRIARRMNVLTPLATTAPKLCKAIKTIPEEYRDEVYEMAYDLDVDVENLSRDEVRRAVRAALAAMPEPEFGAYMSKGRPVPEAPVKPCMSRTLAELKIMAKKLGIAPSNKNKQKLCDEIAAATSSESCENIPIEEAKKSPKKKRTPSESCEDKPMTEVRKGAKKSGIAVDRKTKRQLCDEIAATPAYLEGVDLYELCKELPISLVREHAKHLGVRTTGKTKLTLCEEIREARRGEPERCEDRPMAEVRKEAKDLGIVIDRKTKRRLCDEIAANPETGEQNVDFEELCNESPVTDVKSMAGQLGIPIGKKTKRRLCEEITAKVEGELATPRTRKEPEQLREPVDICNESPIDDVKSMARELGISVGKKTKRRLCEEITAKVEGELATPRTRKEPEQLREPLEICNESPITDVKSMARELGIQVGKKTKRQICNEITANVEGTEACETESVESLGRKLTGSGDIASVAELARSVSREDLVEYAESEGIREPEEYDSEKLLQEMLKGKKCCVCEFPCDETEQCCKMCLKHYAPKAELPAPRPERAEPVSAGWMAVVKRLTGVDRYLSPQELARSVSRHALYEYAESIGARVSVYSSPEEMANEIWAETGRGETATAPIESRRRRPRELARETSVEEALERNISSHVASKGLLDEINDSIDRGLIDDLTKARMKGVPPEREASVKETVVEEEKRAAAEPVIRNAAEDGRISEAEAEAALMAIGLPPEPAIFNIPAPETREVEEEVPPRPLSLERINSIENILEEIRNPETNVTGILDVQRRLYAALGLLH